MTREPTQEQLDALEEFAARYGRCWREELRACWSNGRYPYGLSQDCSAYLQQVRNRLGPAWLTNFRAGS